jgi:tetratricopeptide (TPR) repeat protein
MKAVACTVAILVAVALVVGGLRYLERRWERECNLKRLCLTSAKGALTDGEGADETLRWLKKAESKGPNLPGPLAVQGTLHLRRGEREIALEYYRRALLLLEEKTEETASFYEGHCPCFTVNDRGKLEEKIRDLERVISEEGSKE